MRNFWSLFRSGLFMKSLIPTNLPGLFPSFHYSQLETVLAMLSGGARRLRYGTSVHGLTKPWTVFTLHTEPCTFRWICFLGYSSPCQTDHLRLLLRLMVLFPMHSPSLYLRRSRFNPVFKVTVSCVCVSSHLTSSIQADSWLRNWCHLNARNDTNALVQTEQLTESCAVTSDSESQGGLCY